MAKVVQTTTRKKSAIEAQLAQEFDTREHLEYPFAVILKTQPDELPEDVSEEVARDVFESFHQNIVRALKTNGMQVAFLKDNCEKQTANRVVMLVRRPAMELLCKEWDRTQTARYLKFGIDNVGSLQQDRPQTFTTAQQIALMNNLVTRALDLASHLRDQETTGGEEEGKGGGGSDGTASPSAPHAQWRNSLSTADTYEIAFPLHDYAFNRRLMDFYLRAVRRPRTLLAASSVAVDEIRGHFGERVALYFAFVVHYTLWLAPLAAFALLWALTVGIAAWGVYVRGLALFGFFVSAVWGPLMLKAWKRQARRLCYAWGIRDTATTYSTPNPHNPVFERRQDTITGETVKVYDPKNNRLKIRFLTWPFALVNVAVLLILGMPFVQWFAYAMLAPTCNCCNALVHGNSSDAALSTQCLAIKQALNAGFAQQIQLSQVGCKYFSTCFYSPLLVIGSDRWIFVVIQGIALALVINLALFFFYLAVTSAVTRAENWETEEEYRTQLIRKQFGFIWMCNNFWFLLVGYIYIPFGDKIQVWLLQHGFGWLVPPFGWRSRVINLDEAFVPVLVATQAINLAIETFVPYLIQRHNLKQIEKARLRRAAIRDGTLTEEDAAAAEGDGGGGDGTAAEALPPPPPTRVTDADLALARRMGGDGDAAAAAAAAVDATSVAVAVGGGGGDESKGGDSDDDINVYDVTCLSANRSDDCARLALHVSAALALPSAIPVLCVAPDGTGYDATALVLEGRKGLYDNHEDYLDMAIQHSHVMNYSVVWVLVSIPALINNVLEFGGDLFGLLFTSRRAIPHEDTGIGSWAEMLGHNALASVLVVSGLFVIGTGELEYWAASCNGKPRTIHALSPDIQCFDAWGFRVVVAVLLEHLLLFVVFYIRRHVAEVDEETAHCLRVEAEARSRALQAAYLPSLEPAFTDALHTLFRKHDLDNSGALNRVEMALLLAPLLPALRAPQRELLFSLMDEDDNDAITFAECALGLARAQNDDLLREHFNTGQIMARAVALAAGAPAEEAKNSGAAV